MKIYAQNTQSGKVYYFTNIVKTDKETGQKTFKKLVVGFKKGEEELGNLTPKEWSLGFDTIERKKLVRLEDTNEEKMAFVKETAIKLFIWAWEKTEEDKKRDEDDLNAGKVFIKEYKEYKPKSTFENASNSIIESTQLDDIDELLPF